LSLCHSDGEKAILAIIFTIVKELDPQRILEHGPRQLGAHAVGVQVGLGLGVAPLELRVTMLRGISTFL